MRLSFLFWFIREFTRSVKITNNDTLSLKKKNENFERVLQRPGTSRKGLSQNTS